MNKGDKVSVDYKYKERKSRRRRGTVEYISPFGWVAIRFRPGYVECFWRGEVSG